MKTVCIIQARMGSTRLPGKSMLPLCDKPMLQHIVERVKRAKRLDYVVVAYPAGDDLRTGCEGIGLLDYGGEPNDLVGRYLAAAKAYHADIIVRVCADNPCIQPEFIDQAVDLYLGLPRVFVSTTIVEYKPGLFIDGLGAEVFSLSRLKWLDKATQGQPFYREHPHKLFEDQHLIESWEQYCRRGRHTELVRLDVNTAEDLAFIQDIYSHVYPTNPQFTVEDVLTYLDAKHGNG